MNDSVNEWIVAGSLIPVTLQLVRLAIDLIQVASSSSSDEDSGRSNQGETSVSHGVGRNDTHYGTAGDEPSNNEKKGTNPREPYTTSPEEGRPLIPVASSYLSREESPSSTHSRVRIKIFLVLWLTLAVFFAFAAVQKSVVFPRHLMLSSTAVLALELLFLIRDPKNERIQQIKNVLCFGAVLVLWIDYMTLFYSSLEKTWESLTVLMVATLHLVAAIIDVSYRTHASFVETFISADRNDTEDSDSKLVLSGKAFCALLKPYFWPDAATTGASAATNRFRAIVTWFCVISSKGCHLVSPVFLGWASTALAHQDYIGTMRYSVFYAILSWCGATLKEMQSLVYLKVAQAAYVQLSTTAFRHLHSLSLDWHVRKKMGVVLRSMTRGIAACNTLMEYLFLWLVPAFVECLVVCIIFATYFAYLPLALAVFYFVFVYVVWTILVTLWRKKFRKALAESDNEMEDRFVDSMINFETVKYFTAESYEARRFSEAVQRYQTGSVHMQSSLSFLNISQQAILQICLAISLSLCALGIQKRADCCVQVMGCDSGISKCCQAVTNSVCPGMEVGDFVAVLTYTLNLFAPLNFLGSVYNVVVMALVDLASMSELLAESPDVADSPDAIEIPRCGTAESDIAVEFDNVRFHYPTQSKDGGLKALSFKMKRGTTTAIVGATGEGKTTVSRLLFRFYDVLDGSIRVNGNDIRALTMRSLREAIGVVPQSASLFNDTIRYNLLYGRQEASDEELRQAAEDSQLLEFIESLEQGWETVVGDRGLKLSGGEKQRAAICRCLLKNPPFVILDEATSALDTLTENSVQEALDRLGRDRTVLVIAHRLGTIRNADNIVVLKDGRAAEQGTHDDLLELGGIYANMWNMQLRSTSGSASQNDLTYEYV